MSDADTVMRVEASISNDGKAAVTIPMLPAKPDGFRLVDAKSLEFDIVAGQSAYRFAMPVEALAAWQIVVDTEQLLVIEQTEELEDVLKSFADDHASMRGVIASDPELVKLFEEAAESDLQPLYALPAMIETKPGLANKPDVQFLVAAITREVEILSLHLRDTWVSPLG